MMLQGTQEWHLSRCGKVTASRISDVMAKTKNGWGASRQNYMGELIAERLTGVPAPSYSNAAMLWGTETEPQARAAYEFLRDCEVEQIAFVDHPSIPMAGASPDGLVGADGLVEIKCPHTSTHIDTLLSGMVPDKYVLQMRWQMACTGRQFCDFVSFDPRMPSPMQLFVKRFERNDKRILELETCVREFLTELECKVSALKTQYDLKNTLEAAE